MPDEAEVLGLLPLMLLHDAQSRMGRYGRTVPLDEQDRTLWVPETRRAGVELGF
jgi:predicted RNA polymerase sigma factor